jgi:hypothetical protein
MNIADELSKLHELHLRGALSDEEFAQAKAALLSGAPTSEIQDEISASADADAVTRPRLRSMQIIAGALLIGVTTFLAIVLYLVLVQNGGRGNLPPNNLPIVTFIAAAMIATLGPMSFFVPGIMTQSVLPKIVTGRLTPAGGNPAAFATDGAKLMALYQTTMIVGYALVEGAAFMGCVAYLLDGHWLALGVVAVAVALMLARFPTEGRVRSWVERQTEALSRLRQEQ